MESTKINLPKVHQDMVEKNFRDLNSVFKQALKEKNFACALKAKELIKKFMEFSTETIQQRSSLDVDILSDKEIHSLLESLENKHQEEPKKSGR